ncbi:hypothetical protein MUB24_07640 [Lederbergia sp. NSJ-179]|uniref:tetratricopeptide repeat protein n=1 Tax=Lederbergia sp. NSJ-179 TaxID=2931402 RepID=UPI001FCFF393|nr:hypothetical protein [Lederbergia sp. NSJ-179]MCJ7840779.1 hypothetical protein [Lederbergia sp. NSJ-179]
MNREKLFVQKSFFETFLQDKEKDSPVSVLGKLFFQEQKKTQADLTEIRFAQGEVYFHAQDYETAIFKWENIHNEWEPWARKNMADAYFELDLHETAEEIYQSITTDSLLLNTEIALQLFGLYILQKNDVEAKQMIANAVLIHPDYPNVTKLARAFFEEQEDWESAVELAVNESIRTKNREWFQILQSYIEKGHLCFDPSYFIPVLEVIFPIDREKFDQLTHSLWLSFEDQGQLLQWLKEISALLLALKIPEKQSWRYLPNLFEETYRKLMSSHFPFQDVEKIMPSYLEAWLKTVQIQGDSIAMAAVLTWNDYFPGNINQSIVECAKTSIRKNEIDFDLRNAVQTLIHDMENWAITNGIELEDTSQMRKQNEPEGKEDLSKLLIFCKRLIHYYMQQQETLKKEITDSIDKEEEISAKLQGSINQLKDMEEERTKDLREAFLAIGKEIRATLNKSVPEIIKKSADLIKEDSEFRTIHLELNMDMNNRIHDYIQETVMPFYTASLENWIDNSKGNLEESQAQLKEWENGFNEYLEEKPITLDCDFQILADWQRDAERMTIPIQIDKENIMLRSTPSQMLLKGAGKLLGSFSKNNAVLARSYRHLIQNENYEEICESIATRILYQFQLFEKGIDRDVHLFFRDPLENLQAAVEEIQAEIQENQSRLERLEQDPDLLLGPLKLFQLQSQQYDWLNDVKMDQISTE